MSHQDKTVLVAALAVFAFVVLCPSTPTPQGVVKELSAVDSLDLTTAEGVGKPRETPDHPRPLRSTADPASLLDLLCTRLC